MGYAFYDDRTLGAFLKTSGESYSPSLNTQKKPNSSMEARYLRNGEYMAGLMLAKVKAELKDPNKAYVLDYYRHLQIASKDTRTMARHLRELRFIVKELGKKDAKHATEDDVKDLILTITNTKMAPISKRKHLLTMRVFFSFLDGHAIDSHEYAEITKPIKITLRNLQKDVSKSQKTAASSPQLFLYVYL